MPPQRLDNLPFDVFYQIATSLDDRDCIHLSRTNRIIYDSMQSELIARKTVENVLRYSKEGSIALQAQAGYRKAVSHRFDINEAVATATPYSVSVLAYASDFLYQQGVLCYRVGQEIRLLDVHRAAQRERVLNLHDVLRRLESSPMDRDAAERVKLIHYHDGIVILRVINDNALGDSLLAIDMERHPGHTRRRRLLLQAVVPSNVPIFVRNSRSYMWYGCFTASAANSDGVWSVWGVDLVTLEKIDVPLDRVVDGDLGQTLCFEMYKEHLYAVSTQVASNDDERFSSFYHWFCHAPRQESQQWNDRIWRREHREGPINEMWTDLSIRTDEETGNPVIIECRREWRHGKSENHRTTYIQPLPTPTEAAEAELRRSPWVTDNEDEDQNNNEVQNDNVKNTSDHDTHGQSFDERPEKRLRRNYHAEYEHDQNSRQEFIAARTKYRSYHLSAATFIDLVNDPAPEADGLRSRDRIRLRTVSRKRKCPIDEEETGLPKPTVAQSRDQKNVSPAGAFTSGLQKTHRVNSPTCFAPTLAPDPYMLFPTSVLFYTPSLPRGLPLGNQALILISFDPKIRFPNLPSLRSLKTPITGDIFPVDIPGPGPASSGSLIREARPLYQAIGRGYWLR
ncbi:hypothetical protein N7533_000755 [Penicillium manginii]|uniref:uncharacterized protein n=1 Tax=Penicillium manginii TaxID=203109 RepID=UPI002547A550|nr:uncharacterized protein N7533_000755 [Penicillium manginii]KAJ5768172.1 hypothetical protein N7533_000755 [Penicillium manginii]